MIINSIPQDRGDVLISPGMILMWSGSADTIPAGWQLCDGTNGTPDLRDRFVVGGGGKYAPDDVGGSETVSVAHSHSFSATTGGENKHASIARGNSSTITVAISHSHDVSGNTNSGGGSVNIIPPFFALCYIQKIGV